MNNSLFDAMPLWLLLFATVLFVLLAIEIGFRAGVRAALKSENERHAPIDAMVGSTLGLLAFMLAFTFGMATSRYDTRNQLLVDDAIAIRTADLRAQLLPEPHRGEFRTLLREYVDIRLEGTRVPARVPEILTRSEEIQAELWARAGALAQDTSTASLARDLMPEIIEMGDKHVKRVTAGLQNRLPATIWIALFCLAALAMSISGYRAGIAGRRSLVATLTLVMAYSAVILLIADLDRPRQGLLQINEQALIHVQERLHRP